MDSGKMETVAPHVGSFVYFVQVLIIASAVKKVTEPKLALVPTV